MDKNRIALLLFAAVVALYQVLWASLLQSTFTPIETVTVVLAAFLAGVAIGGLVLRQQMVKNPMESLGVAQLGMIVAGVGVYFLKGPSSIPILLLQESLIGFSVTVVLLYISQHEAMFLAAAAGAIISEFLLLPELDSNSILIAAAINLLIFLMLEARPVPLGVKEEFSRRIFLRGFLLGAFWNAWAIITLFQFGSSSKTVALLAAIAAVGMLRRIRLDIPPQLGVALLSGAAILLIGRYPGLPFIAIATLAIWLLIIILSTTRPEGAVGLIGGSAIGVLAFYIAQAFLGIANAFALTIFMSIVFTAFSKERSPASFPLLFAAFFLGVLILYQPLELARAGGASDLAKDFAVHMPAVILGDGKDVGIFNGASFLTSKKTYDVLVLHLSEPLDEGFYAPARLRLKKGGVLVQTFPLSFSEKKFKTLLRNTGEVYPHTSMWMVEDNGILVSSSSPIVFDYPRLKRSVRENTELASDLKAVFFATSFNNMTLVDSFTFLYFASEEELADYVKEEGFGGDALRSIFEFKMKRSNTSNAVAYPPIKNAYMRSGDDVEMPFFGISVKLDESWNEVASGTITQYSLIENTSQYGVFFDKTIAFMKGNVTLGLKAYTSEVMMTLRDSPVTARLLEEEIDNVAAQEIARRGYEITHASEVVVGDEKRAVVFGSLPKHEARALAMVWYCRSTDAINVVTLDYLAEDETIEPLLQSVRCIGW